MIGLLRWFRSGRRIEAPPVLTPDHLVSQIKRDDALHTGNPLRDDPTRFGPGGERTFCVALATHLSLINDRIRAATNDSNESGGRTALWSSVYLVIAQMAVEVVRSGLIARRPASVMSKLVVRLLAVTRHVPKGEADKAALVSEIEGALDGVVGTGDCDLGASISRILAAVNTYCRHQG